VALVERSQSLWRESGRRVLDAGDVAQPLDCYSFAGAPRCRGNGIASGRHSLPIGGLVERQTLKTSSSFNRLHNLGLSQINDGDGAIILVCNENRVSVRVKGHIHGAFSKL
jgi:hypothetical protein